jgi:hypothetical protein
VRVHPTSGISERDLSFRGSWYAACYAAKAGCMETMNGARRTKSNRSKMYSISAHGCQRLFSHATLQIRNQSQCIVSPINQRHARRGRPVRCVPIPAQRPTRRTNRAAHRYLSGLASFGLADVEIGHGRQDVEAGSDEGLELLPRPAKSDMDDRMLKRGQTKGLSCYRALPFPRGGITEICGVYCFDI